MLGSPVLRPCLGHDWGMLVMLAAACCSKRLQTFAMAAGVHVAGA